MAFLLFFLLPVLRGAATPAGATALAIGAALMLWACVDDRLSDLARLPRSGR